MTADALQDVKAVLLVGGLGSRLKSVVPSTPKPLASIGETPFLDLLVRELRMQGIQRLVMCTGHLAEQIESRFADGHEWGVSIEYSREQTPLGTGGAIKLAQRYLRDSSDFLVLNGDSFLKMNFREFVTFHRSHSGAATMAVVQVEDASRYGTVTVDGHGRVRSFAEKTGSHTPGLVNGGVYALRQTIWPCIPDGPASLEREVFPRLLEQGLYTQPQSGMFIDIGTPEDYQRAQHALRSY
jgi:NDP-sugar pyrophosphorylase family protein